MMRASVVGGDADANHHLRAAKSSAYLARSWDNLSSYNLREVAWRVIEWCGGTEEAGARQRTVTAPRCVHQIVGGDAGSNHHFRAAKHRVLDTLLGQSKPKITFRGHTERPWKVVLVRRGRGRGSGSPQHDHVCDATTTSEPPSIVYLTRALGAI